MELVAYRNQMKGERTRSRFARARNASTGVLFGMVLGFGPVTDAALASAAALADATHDRVHASRFVPDAARKVGKVRLLSRGDAVVVQTLLATKLLSRVLAEIAKKEERNWPQAGKDKSANASDAQSGSGTREYLAALTAARETLEARGEKGPASSRSRDRRKHLLIEFAADGKDAAVLVGTFASAASASSQDEEDDKADADDHDDHDIVAAEREIFSTLELPRAYILRQIRLILADSFKMEEREVDRLGPLGPAASASAAPPTPTPASPPAPSSPSPSPSPPRAASPARSH